MCLEGSQPQQKKSRDASELRPAQREESGAVVKHGVGGSDLVHGLGVGWGERVGMVARLISTMAQFHLNFR